MLRQSYPRTPLNRINMRHRVNLKDIKLPVLTLQYIYSPPIHAQRLNSLNAWTLYLVVANQFIPLHKLESKSPVPHKPIIITLALIDLLIGCEGFAAKHPHSILSISWDKYAEEVMLAPTGN